MQLKNLKHLAEGTNLDAFNKLIKAEKGLGLRGTKVPKVSDEIKAKAAQMALDAWKNGKGMAHVDTTGLRKTLNGMDEVVKLMERFGGDRAVVAKAQEEARKVEELASLAYSLSSTVYHIRQVRTNSSWKPELREFAKQMAKELGLK